MKKTAAVYDRWLYTLGGGEQVAFGFAQMLRDLGYSTTILTHKEIDVEKAQGKLRVNLKGIILRYLPPLSSNEISKYTEEYDVFINTSYLDYFPNRAKCGILSVFFPSKIYLTPYEYMKRALILPSFRRLLIYPIQYEGFLYDTAEDGRIFKWMGKRSSILFNKHVPNLEIVLYFHTLAFSSLENMHFYLDDIEIFPVAKSLSHTRNNIAFSFQLHRSKGKRFTVELASDEYSEKVALLKLTIKDPRYSLYNFFKTHFPKWEMRLHGGPGITKLSDLESYSKIVTISEFSQKWIQKYWGLESDILYPSTDTSVFQPAAKKKNWIIHVGRFFVSGHCKKQFDLAQVFTKMVNEGQAEDWELHFVGSVHEGEQHRQYFEQVKRQSDGYPVFFHTDVSFSQLQKLLGQAKIYWHATGLDENEDIQPILFEHFGITTVEAMASGCVPVVIGAGGQKEIVTSDSGFLWRTRAQLIEQTLHLIHNEKVLTAYSKHAVKRSEFFDRRNGTERFSQLLHTAMESK